MIIAIISWDAGGSLQPFKDLSKAAEMWNRDAQPDTPVTPEKMEPGDVYFEGDMTLSVHEI